MKYIKVKVINTFWREGFFYNIGEIIELDKIAKKQLVDEMKVCEVIEKDKEGEK